MRIVNEITIFELIVPYMSSIIIAMTVALYIYMNKKVYNKRYSAMLKVLITMFIFNFGYLLQVHYVLHGQMKLAGNAYAISQIGMTFFVPVAINHIFLLVDVSNLKLKKTFEIIGKVFFILGIISIPLSLAAANLDFEILHRGTRVLPGAFATNLARQAVPEIYFSIRNVFYLLISLSMVGLNTFYCIKNKNGTAALMLTLVYLFPLVASFLDVFVNMGRPLFFPVSAHFSRNTVGMALFAIVAFVSSMSMFVSEYFLIDVIKNKLAVTNIQNNAAIEEVNKSRDVFLEVQKKLSEFVSSLNINSKSISSSCRISMLYTNSLLETNEMFGSIDEEQKDLYNESRRRIDGIYSSFEVLKKAVSGQADTLDSIVTEIADSSDILGNVQWQIEHLTKMSNDLVESYSKVKVTMLDSFSSLDSIIDASSAVKKSILFIKDISEKTNSLSVNANIQASKSSDWAHSFSVVANEIGDLALDSKTAADRIDDLFLLVTKTTNEFIATKMYIIDVFDSIIDNVSNTMLKIKLISNIVSAQIADNKNISENTKFAKELNLAIADEIEKRYDEIYDVIQRFDSLDDQFEFFREQLVEQTDEITKLSKDMNELIDLSKELNSISDNIINYTRVIEREVAELPVSY